MMVALLEKSEGLKIGLPLRERPEINVPANHRVNRTDFGKRTSFGSPFCGAKRQGTLGRLVSALQDPGSRENQSGLHLLGTSHQQRWGVPGRGTSHILRTILGATS